MNPNSEVTGVTQETGFIRASQLIECKNCGEYKHPEKTAAIRPKDHAVMLCKDCMPEPPEEWL
jgi:ribosomal protein L32